MSGYLDKIKKLQQGETQSGTNEAALPQFHLEYEINEFNEIRSALLGRLRKGQHWLLDQHRRWQSGDATAADDAAFSKTWNGWWELDYRLRAEHGLAGCIYANLSHRGFPKLTTLWDTSVGSSGSDPGVE